MEKVSLLVADYQTHHDLVIKSTQVYPPRLDIINAHNPLVEQSAGDRGRLLPGWEADRRPDVHGRV